MEWFVAMLITLVAIGASVVGALLFVDRRYEGFVERRLLFERRMEIYYDMAATVGRIKQNINHASGDDTVRHWRDNIVHHLNTLLCNAYEWSIFLPDAVKNEPETYANTIIDVLRKLDNVTTDNVRAVAEIIDDVRKVEERAADRLRNALYAQLN